jgi:acetyl esterase/lipase
MKYAIAFRNVIIILIAVLALSKYNGSNSISVSHPAQAEEINTSSGQSEMSANAGISTRIRIIAKDKILYAEMNDSEPARAFVDLLPLNLDCFDRIGLVKSSVLPERISDDGERTRKYAVGSIFYWPEGPEVAICYSDHLPETVVDIIHIGKVESGVEFFREYEGNLRFEIETDQNSDKKSTRILNANYPHVGIDDSALDVINHPAFSGFGRFILPNERSEINVGIRLNDINALLPYHSHINPDTTVGAINHMIDKVNEGETLFYDFYSEEEKRSDPAKKSTGLFFFKGKEGAPFAVVCPGGGFSYVGSIHEGFPHAIELSQKGYNAFVLQYRVGGEKIACEDLATALSYIFRNAATLEVGTQNYSLWGSSAGARMVANIGSDGTVTYGVRNLPKPSVVVMAYTGHSRYTSSDPPTFVAVGDRDGLAPPSVMERRVNVLKNLGIDVECHVYGNLGHGFGLGIGTSSEGWLNDAVRFWEKHMAQ